MKNGKFYVKEKQIVCGLVSEFNKRKVDFMKNIYSYTNTEIGKMKREELLKLKYEQDKDYFEHLNGSRPNWSDENPFDKYVESMKHYTVSDLRERLKWR